MAESRLLASRILIVDDEHTNVDQLEQLLQLKGFTNIKGTTDPRKVEGLLEDYKPDIILLDLQMPYIDGFEILELLGKECTESEFIPVIVLTADVTRESRERALSLGAGDFLTKPFDFADVILRIRNQLRTRHLHLEVKSYAESLESKVHERTKELSLAHEQLIAQERYKAMGQMASGIAHDFSNAVAIIMGNAEILLSYPEELADKDLVTQTIKTIHTASRDAASIIQRLREFYKSDNQDEIEQAADLPMICNDAISLTESKWRAQAQSEGRTIRVETACKPTTVRMSSSKVREIITNLVFNAVDAMPEGGIITVGCREKNGFGLLTVADDGIGMSEEVRQKCLDMFFSTKGAKGTGLGLGVVHDTVRKHGGQIEIETEEGAGTKFTISLPLARILTRENPEQDFSLPRGLRILAVDDENQILKVIERQLTKDGHQVVTANSGRDGLIKFLADTFDLIITDNAMPGINGRQMAETVRGHDSTIPIIMITGFANAVGSDSGVPLGVDRLLDKPISILKLREVIYELFSQK